MQGWPHIFMTPHTSVSSTQPDVRERFGVAVTGVQYMVRGCVALRGYLSTDPWFLTFVNLPAICPMGPSLWY